MFLDRAGGHLFLRIVYAGPPGCGKAETLKALVRSLRGWGVPPELYSPVDADDGSPYFHWAEHQGGLYQGCRLHSQIVSVPSRESLGDRRRALIEQADVLVLIADAQPHRAEANRTCLAEVQQWLARDPLPPVDVIFQLNKVNLPGALSESAARRAMGLGPSVELYPTDALRGEGMGFAFVAAVRACVRRADRLLKAQQMQLGKPDVTTGQQLLERLRRATKMTSVREPTSPFPVLTRQPAAQAVGSEQAGRELEDAAPDTGAARPAVMPMADWLAANPDASVEPKPVPPPTPATPPEAAAPVDATQPPPVPAADQKDAWTRSPDTVPAAPVPQAQAEALASTDEPRPAVMPMADWLAQVRAAELARPQPSAEPDVEVASPSEEPLAPVARPLLADAPASDRPAVMPMADWLAQQAAGDGQPTADPAARGLPAFELSDADASGEDDELTRILRDEPTPWLDASEWEVVAAYPRLRWAEARAQAGRRPTRDARSAVHVGAGWYARSHALSTDAREARAKYDRLVNQLQELGAALSKHRCVVLTRTDPGRWAVLEVVQRTATLATLVVAALHPGQTSRQVLRLLVRASALYLAAANEFQRQQIALPVRLDTVADQDDHTVYTDFLPNEAIQRPTEPPSDRLENELRQLMRHDRLANLKNPEMLRELELLAEGGIQPAPAGVLEKLLVGG